MPDYVMPENLGVKTAPSISDNIKAGTSTLENATKLVEGLNNFMDKLTMFRGLKKEETGNPQMTEQIIQAKAEKIAQRDYSPEPTIIRAKAHAVYKTQEAITELKKLLGDTKQETTIAEYLKAINTLETEGVLIPIVENFLNKYVGVEYD